MKKLTSITAHTILLTLTFCIFAERSVNMSIIQQSTTSEALYFVTVTIILIFSMLAHNFTINKGR